jgi:putative zinc finger protein
MRNHIQDRTEEYLMGVLEPRALAVFEQHVSECRSCALALADARQSHAFLAWLQPAGAPPEPSPDFYRKIERSIEKKASTGWLGTMAAAFQRPKLAYPLLFLVLGLLFAAWTMDFQPEWSDSGVLGIPPARFSQAISSDADLVRGREMVMVSLVDSEE